MTESYCEEHFKHRLSVTSRDKCFVCYALAAKDAEIAGMRRALEDLIKTAGTLFDASVKGIWSREMQSSLFLGIESAKEALSLSPERARGECPSCKAGIRGSHLEGGPDAR